MPKPRVLEKYEVDESRCILCGICVDACPYDALRDGADFELAHTSPGRADGRPHRPRVHRPRDRGRPTSGASATGLTRATAAGRPPRSVAPPAGAAAVGRRAAACRRRRARQRPRHGERPRRRSGAPGDGAAGAASGHHARSRRVPIPDTSRSSASSWDDVLFVIFAGTMLGSGLLVVTMRDIIRCGLAMIVCFGALAGIYVIARRAARRRRPGPRLHRRDQRPHPVRDHAHPDEGRRRPGSSSRPRPCRRRSPRSILAVVLALTVIVPTDWGAATAERPQVRDGTTLAPPPVPTTIVLPFEIVSVLLLAAVIGGIFLAKREPTRPRTAGDERLARRLPRPVRPALLRSGRSASSPGATRSACSCRSS